MEGAIERAYKRKCFQGRGTAARLLDRAFFSALSGACLFIVLGRLLLSVLLSGAVFLLLSLLSRRRWDRFRRQLWNSVAMELKRENWLKQEAERIRRQGGVILFPLPKEEQFMGLCLRSGPGTAFHTFGEPDKEWMAQAAGLGCSMTFHPWGVGETPNREQIEDRIRQ